MGVKIRLCGLGMGAVWYCGMVVLCIVLYWRSYILCSIDFGAFKKDGRVPLYSSWDQGKKLAFPWFSLAESGLFNGLQRIQIKKSGRASTRVSGLRAKRTNVASVHYFWASTYHIKSSDIRKGKINRICAGGECSGLGSHRSVLAAKRSCFNTIAFLIILIAIPCFFRRIRLISR
jgi:hypothetical protein